MAGKAYKSTTPFLFFAVILLCTCLKLAVENVIVTGCFVNIESVAYYILFADAHSCSLLKEYAISYFFVAQE
jgi:hypothetical protein